MSVTATVVAPAAPGPTWERWTDFAAWPDWNPGCVSARADGPLEEGTRLDLCLRHPSGRAFYTRPRLSRVEPGALLEWEARGLGLRATTRTELSEEHDGTRVTISASASGPMAFTYRVTMTDGTQARMYVAMLDALSETVRR